MIKQPIAIQIDAKTCRRFFLVLLTTISLVRILAISLYYLLDKEFLYKVINDPFHHYQVGLLLLLVSYPLRKLINPLVLSGVGLGIMLEEWPILLANIGFNTKNIYHTKIDFILIFGFIVFIYVLLSVPLKKYSKK